VLAPHALKSVVTEAKEANYAGILTDASNHGNIKLFPVLIQYFSVTNGITTRIIELEDLKNENAETISTYLNELLII
jgi:hypothetical protein